MDRGYPTGIVWIIVASWISFVFVRGQSDYTFPANEYEYSLRRDELMRQEQELEGNNITLTEIATRIHRQTGGQTHYTDGWTDRQ
ncbi:hypothetical protein LSH36_519g01010 [Paralvinella palmiformis]|uniref:Uncharacterized protein n=1 Tax=Paralvinella palmiformis TaxID=53620 RepID=A0AAD9J7S8_9ANNE|nr:hypothetical protein LSH36_519g01010 [Paralvinella palmiformis]